MKDFIVGLIIFMIGVVGILVISAILAGVTLYLIGEKDAGYFWSGVVFGCTIIGLSQIANELK